MQLAIIIDSCYHDGDGQEIQYYDVDNKHAHFKVIQWNDGLKYLTPVIIIGLLGRKEEITVVTIAKSK